MSKYIPYLSGDEWHYLANKYCAKFGYDYTYRDLFNYNNLSPVELRRYQSVREKTIKARKNHD